MTLPVFAFRDPALAPIWAKVAQGQRLDAQDGLAMFRTADALNLGRMAAWAAAQRHGDKAYWVLNRQCNPTNLCVLSCRFCEFARKKGQPGAWAMTLEQVLAHCEGGIREIHMVGGLHPDWKFQDYLGLVAEIRRRHPRLGIKAWTAVEIEWFSRISKASIREVLKELKAAGLNSLPGGGAEVFSERVRHELFPQKIGWESWREVHRTAHELGIPSNATLLYGAIETYAERVDHLLKLRGLEDEAPGFLAFMPLTFQPGGTGIPAQRASALEDARTVAASRLLLDNFPHIKAYWAMMGVEMASVALSFGASDMDGTIGQEKVAHMAQASSPEGLAAESITRLIREAGKTPVQRDIFYQPVAALQPS